MSYEVALPQEDEGRTFSDYWDALKRRRKPAMILASSILVVGLFAIFLWPTTYRSTATILIEEPEVPPGLVPTTVTTYASRQVQYINQRVMTRTNLAQIIEKFNLYPEERKYLPTLMLVPDVEKEVKIDVVDVQTPGHESSQPTTTTIAFQLSFQHSNPNIAREVANELVSLYLGENVRVRTEQTAQTSQFMNAEVERLDKEIKDLDQQIAQYKHENEEALPEYRSGIQQGIQRLDEELRDITAQLNASHSSQIMLEAQLAQIQPLGTRLLPDGKPVLSPTDQLKALQTQQAMLESRYGPDHPDVVRIKREIAGVKAQLGADVDLADTQTALTQAKTDLAEAREKYSPDHPESKRLEKAVTSLQARQDAPKSKLGADKLDPDNPAYIQLRAQLNTLKSNDDALVRKAQEIRARMIVMEKNMAQSTDVERGLSDLGRKYQSATQSYQIAREKLTLARMGESLETQSKGERFSLVEPPDVPLIPASPNRPMLLVLLIFLTLATGLGWPQVAESLDHSINGARAVERIQGFPPIAEIPLIETEADRQTNQRKNIVWLLMVPGVLLVGALLIHFLWIPLDVLWYVAVRKLGL